MNEEYYLNREEYGNCMPTRSDKYLNKNNYLSEYTSEEDKEEVRSNLGISTLLEELNQKIDEKVIEKGDVAWDLKPTCGNYNKVLSSNALYNTFLKYALKNEVDRYIQELWQNTCNKFSEYYDRIEKELNELNTVLSDKIEDLRCSMSAGSLEARIFVLEQELESIAATCKNGIIIANEFGSKEYATMSQKAITDQINRLWDKIESLTGESTQGITMTVNPDYFVRGKKQLVHITARSSEQGPFEYIKFIANGNIIGEAKNTDYYETDTVITDETRIECIAKIRGTVYTKSKLIRCYDNFFLLAGQFNIETITEDIQTLMDTAYHSRNYSLPIKDNLRSNRNITCNDYDHIVVIVPKSLVEVFQRADMNGVEIPFDTYDLNDYYEDEQNYVLYVSKNVYSAGTYNIDING